MRDEFEVEQSREGDKDAKDWDEEAGCHPRRLVRYRVELHPAQDCNLNQKQQNACRKK